MTVTPKTQATKTSRKGKSRKAARQQPETAGTTKLDLLIAKISRPGGAALADLMAVTGWQAHSVRGAIAGSLKKKGHVILSERIDGVRRYRIGEAE